MACAMAGWASLLSGGAMEGGPLITLAGAMECVLAATLGTLSTTSLSTGTFLSGALILGAALVSGIGDVMTAGVAAVAKAAGLGIEVAAPGCPG